MISSFFRRVPLRMRRVLPQCGHRAGGLTVCGTRWACASEVAIRGTMAALYHALGTSRILEGLMTCRGLVEPREGIGCRQCRSACLAGRSVTLQAVGPPAGGVVDARNLDC